jgi:hypothetical protein
MMWKKSLPQPEYGFFRHFDYKQQIKKPPETGGF